MKVCYLTNIPSPYRVDYFNELGKLCDLTVLFEKRSSNERDVKWKCKDFNSFRGLYLDGISITTDSALSLKGVLEVRKGKFDIIVSTNFSTATGIMQIGKMKICTIPYFLEADGGFAGSGSGIKERIKKLIISGAVGYFSTSSACDQYFLTYGATNEKLVRYPFTSIWQEEILDKFLSADDKKKYRDELGMKEDKIIISVGRFSYHDGYGKGFDTLVEACRMIPKEYGVYIIGDTPTREFISKKEKYLLSNLHFVPFVVKDELQKYYRAADLSVLLSRGEAWGLVINESLANGTPVIATNACIAAQEMIVNGQNGFVVPVNEPEIVCERIQEYYQSWDVVKTQKMCLDQARKYTIERMAQCHYSAFENFIKSK